MACIFSDYFYNNAESFEGLYGIEGPSSSFDASEFTEENLSKMKLCVNGISMSYNATIENTFRFGNNQYFAILPHLSSHGEIQIQGILISESVPYLDEKGYVKISMCEDCPEPITNTCLFDETIPVGETFPYIEGLSIPIDSSLLVDIPAFTTHVDGIPFAYDGKSQDYSMIFFYNSDLQCSVEMSIQNSNITSIGICSNFEHGSSLHVSCCTRSSGDDDGKDMDCSEIETSLMDYIIENNLPFSDYFDDNGTFIPKGSGGGGGGGGGCTLCVNFTMGTPVEDEYSIDYPYTGDKTYGEILSAVESCEALVAVFGFDVEGVGIVTAQYPMTFVHYADSTPFFGDMRLVILGDDPLSLMIGYGDPAVSSSEYPAFVISVAK